MTFNNFKAVKSLALHMILKLNWNTYTNGKKVKWNDVKVLEVAEDSPKLYKMIRRGVSLCTLYKMIGRRVSLCTLSAGLA